MTQAFLSEDVINTAVSTERPSSLYERDFAMWVEATAQLLRERRFAELDVINLLDEVESMGNSDKHALSNNLVVFLLHLLKWKYQSNKRSRSWEKSIAEHRRRIRRIFQASPSLKRYFEQVFDECYLDARKQANIETRLGLEHFPIACPFTPEQSINEDFLPD